MGKAAKLNKARRENRQTENRERSDMLSHLKRYRIPQKYADWNLMVDIIREDCSEENHRTLTPEARVYHDAVCTWVNTRSPLYLISSELLDAFSKSSVTRDVYTIKEIPLTSFLLLFPTSSPMKDRSRDHQWNYLFVSMYKLCQHVENVNIDYVYADYDGHISPGTIDFRANTQSHYKKCLCERCLNMKDYDDFYNNRILQIQLEESIVLQAILAIIYKPDLITDEIPSIQDFTGDGFAIASNTELKTDYLYPRWLGKEYQPKSTHSSRSVLGGTHASPLAHWRRGHWRNQPIGNGKQESKLIWIEPTFVNP